MDVVILARWLTMFALMIIVNNEVFIRALTLHRSGYKGTALVKEVFRNKPDLIFISGLLIYDVIFLVFKNADTPYTKVLDYYLGKNYVDCSVLSISILIFAKLRTTQETEPCIKLIHVAHSSIG